MKVWLDMDEGMGADSINSMAKAIENAAVVCCFLTPSYQKSINCKTEVEYAYNRNIPIIACIVGDKNDKTWQPSGWLGIIIGSCYYVDFKDDSDSNVRLKARELIDIIKTQYGPQIVQNDNDYPREAFPPLLPITSTQNFNEIFQTKLESHSMKDFKNYFLEHAKLTEKIECDANVLLTDAHLYELSQFDWPHLETIRIRACPHLTPFVMNYIEQISKKQIDRQINANVELMLHSHNTIENKSNSIDNTIAQLEPFFGKSKKISIIKVLIYHANTQNDSMLSSKHMIINQIQKSKENSSMLLNYLSSIHDECQVAFLECASFILFKELYTAFHPQIIYMIVSNVDDLLKCFFSLDCNASYSILQKQQIRLIILNNNESNEQFLSNIYLQLECLSKSADEIYSQYINETPENIRSIIRDKYNVLFCMIIFSVISNGFPAGCQFSSFSQGVRPHNVLFLIHEVFEGLVNESFSGVTYDIAFPCPDCLDSV
ncbi:unnamed protein product [Rotaria sp. Silwood1]|nr:unnamed protein product [Rotaria sp. Silwood1]